MDTKTRDGLIFLIRNKLKSDIENKNLDAILVIKTNTCDTSIRLYRLPLTFTLYLQLKMLIKADYNQQMHSTWHSTIICAKLILVSDELDN